MPSEAEKRGKVNVTKFQPSIDLTLMFDKIDFYAIFKRHIDIGFSDHIMLIH
jgi:hypothetical protein